MASFIKLNHSLVGQNCLSLISLVLMTNVLISNCSRGRSESPVKELTKEATQHLLNMERYGSCQTPKPQVIYPNSDPSKVLIPRGTILHRCNDISGCCQHSTHSCQPIESQSVEVVFFTQSLKINSRFARKRRFEPIIEVINMKNHTKCQCLPINHNSLDGLGTN